MWLQKIQKDESNEIINKIMVLKSNLFLLFTALTLAIKAPTEISPSMAMAIDKYIKG